MVAYVISEVQSVRPEGIERYLELAESSISQFGGTYIVNTREFTALEGHLGIARYVIVEFPSVEKARSWYESNEYAQALNCKPDHLIRKMFIVTGLQIEVD